MTQKNYSFMFATIVAVFCFLIGAVSIETVAIKVLRTSWAMYVLRDNTLLYNEQSVKTDSMTKKEEQNQKRRQEFYNSNDFIVRVFANSLTAIKLLLILLSLVFIIGIPISILIFVCWRIDEYHKKRFLLWKDKRKKLYLEWDKKREKEYKELLEIIGE